MKTTENVTEITMQDIEKRAKFFENINTINDSLSHNLTVDERKYTMDKEIRENGKKQGLSEYEVDAMLVEWHAVHHDEHSSP